MRLERVKLAVCLEEIYNDVHEIGRILLYFMVIGYQITSDMGKKIVSNSNICKEKFDIECLCPRVKSGFPYLQHHFFSPEKV